MTPTKQEANPDGARRLVDSIEDVEQSSLEAIRRFLDTVDGAFPALSDDGLRRTIIDSAFQMVEQLVGASSQFARNAVKVIEDALGDRSGAEATAKKATAKKATAKKATAKKATAKKATAKKATAKKATAKKATAKKATAKKSRAAAR